MSKNSVIEASGLVKVYDGRRALDGLDLTVQRGQVFGFLGPNGAGKTTTIRVLATLTRPDAGSARVLGHDVLAEPDAVRARVAVTGQFASLDEDLTGHENLVILGRLHGLNRPASRRRADDLLAAFDLTDAAGRPVADYSGGMRRRLDIGASLVVTPDLLFLDEPTTGLDPRSRGQVWELVRRIAATGTTVLLTTQYLEEADQLAERIAVIDHGRIVAEGTPAELKARVGAGTLHIRLLTAAQRPQAQRILAEVLGNHTAQQAGDLADTGDGPARGSAGEPGDGTGIGNRTGTGAGREPGRDPGGDPFTLSVPLGVGGDAARLVGHALTRLADAGVAVAEVTLGQPSLDEAFLTLTGRPAGTDQEDVHV